MQLNTQQLKAKTHPQGPLLILAGAGTGKTTTIVERMVFLIEKQHVQPSSILALTFSVKAAEHLKEKLVDEIGPIGAEIHASTFHSFAQSIIEEYKSELDLLYNPKLMNDSEINFLLREKFNELDYIHSELYRRNPIQAIKSLKSLFDQFREELFTAKKRKALFDECNKTIENENLDSKALEHQFQLMDAINIFPLYQQWKKEENRIDYGDMISNLWKLLSESKNVQNELQRRFTHIIVDEFQDNNHAFSEAIKVMAEPENNITVVGDDDQCIYSFRGANIQNVSGFKSTYEDHPNYAEIPLMENYRSTIPILELANEVISLNPHRVEKGVLYSTKLSPIIPKLYEGTKEQQLLQIKTEIDKHISNDVQHHQIAILSRTHSICNTVSNYLTSNGIKNQYYSERLFDNKLVKDILCAFQILGKTGHWKQAVYRLIKNKYSDDRASKIIPVLSVRNCTLLSELIKGIGKEKDICEWLGKIEKIDSKIDDKNLIQITETLIKWVGIYQIHIQCNTSEDVINIHILNQFMEFIQKYIHAYPASDLQQFVRYLHVSWEVNDIFIDPVWVKKIDGIQIMTVHQSKGKEFPHVIIPFMETNSFPPNFKNTEYIQYLPVHWRHWDLDNRSTKALHYEEERRIFYVGITRAEETLTLLGPEKRQSQFTKDLTSPFIEREKIMNEATPTEKIDGLLATYQQKLMDSMTFEKWDDTYQLIHAIKCITDIKNNKVPQWESNIYEQNILAELSPYGNDIEISSPLTLSATSINSYIQCPLQYRFKEVDKIPVLSKKPYFQLGKVVHDVLEHFHRNKLSTKDELLSLLDEFWSNEGFEYKQEESQYKADALAMLKNYFDYFCLHPHHPQFIEESFSFDLNNCTLKGRCDRIDINEDGGVEIYDYKTSKSSKLPTERELKKDMQLAIYALFSLHYGVKNESGEPKKQIPEKVALLLLRQEEIESSIHFELDELVEKKEEIEAIADSIYEKKFDAKSGFHCNYCEYKDLICPEFN